MKKSILMITPENKEINRFRKRQINNFIQITMPYLAAFIDENKYNITLIDEYNQKIPFEKYYDLVVVTVNTANAPHCYNIAKIFKDKGSKVAFGGPHATLLPEEVKEHCDVVIIGEAEESWPRFLDDFYQGSYDTEYRCLNIPTLERIPIPRRDLIKGRWFTKGAVFATRGCPYSCSYCNLKQIYEDSFRKRPINEVIKDIKNSKSKFFVFWGDNFFGDLEYAKELLKELSKLNKKWAAQVTLERCKDEEVLKLAQKAGCIYFFVGLESFSKETLESVNKGLNNVDKYKELIDSVQKYGICIQAGIIFGFDTDTKEVFKKTLHMCNYLGIDGVTVSILTPLPKTSLYYQLKEEGRLLTNDWSYYNGKTRVAFKPKNMSAEELFDGYMWFRRNFYSLKSITTRLRKSKANILYNLIVNLGYKVSIRKTK
ncbi:B12-binding domain-containing radical SAM protein [Terrisporobacter mayombei]|uniref:Bacteriochlorophyllide d C-12(1)-methyltransferase n=1 Tax=Terrisporobacter mayombei TaxID=1541 RepID=A0ABY9PY01_9FIRM|nr:radical SAM protein [Terrisporobacter mayombei]MCC3868007.1 B12-binding domain-containing radical SAM protein [Terrisporobacter mayombei]WMT80143.1 Bacteriochlorophyllide d C-12(1)-methyltransferase [Terrisporobacter mayombei]